MCIITKNVSLLPWVVCVSGISSCFNNGSWTLYRSIYVVRGTRWWNIMNLIYEQQGCNSQCDVRLMNNIRLRIFCHQMNTFIKTFMLLTERDAITSTSTHGTFFVIRPPSSSFATLSTDTHHLFVRPAEDFYIKTTTKNSVSWSTTFRVNSEKLYNIVNYNSQPLIILLLWQHITIRDYPPIPKNVIKHYNILSIAENWYIFFSSQIPTPRAYSTTPILYRNCS